MNRYSRIFHHITVEDVKRNTQQDIELKKIDANMPDHDLEIVAFWASEQERLEWVARPIHDQVFNQVLSSTKKVTYTLKTVKNNW